MAQYEFMKMKYLTILLCVVLLQSCGEDPISESIIGIWAITSFEASECHPNNGAVPYNEVDDSGCLSTIFRRTCMMQFDIKGPEDAKLTFTDPTGSQEIPFGYLLFEGQDFVSLFDRGVSRGLGFVARVNGDRLTLTVNDFRICDEFDIRFRRL